MAVDPARAKSLFLAASDLTSQTERDAYLDRECGDEADLRARVETLLRAHDEPGSPDPPEAQIEATIDSKFKGDSQKTIAPDPDATLVHRVPTEAEIEISDRYKLQEKIGEGGMGEVWVAKQTEPVKRKVALKLIKTGMDSRAVMQRFEQERQALALMDHPNIARVLDGGMTSTGQLFFVMELVNGLPLDDFCDEAKLTPKERLELFVPICQAVQHAHQKGIVHRDLKPANILVTMIDGRPVPKVIDFGVAKATSGKLTEETMSTGFGAVVGTLEYMSPEQAGFSSDDVDTRADIYSLGVILYELLTGLRPFDASRLKRAALMEMIQIIKEEDPSKPSTRLSTDDSLPSVAALRQTDPKKLTALLRGDLDWVVMKCLEKQRNRRYDTTNALIRDIQRYLADEVVEARPQSAGYRRQKFARRNKGQVIAASLLLLALLVGIVGTTWGLVEARRQGTIARNSAAEKEEARSEEAKRVEERDEAIRLKDLRAKERDEALQQVSLRADELKHRLGVNEVLLANTSLEDGDVELAAEHLDQVSLEQRGWDWRYQNQRVSGGIYTFHAHATLVSSVSFSPDGSQIVTSGGTEARVWDARTGDYLFELKGRASHATFSSDGALIVTSGAKSTPTIWDAKTRKVVRKLDDRSEFVALNPDATRIVTGTGGIWNIQTGKLELKLDGINGAVAFTPDGTQIVAAAGGRSPGLKFFDAVKGEVIRELELERGKITSMSLSPDGKRIIYNRGNSAWVLDLTDGKKFKLDHRPSPEVTMAGSNNGIMGVSYSPDGRRVVTAGGYQRFTGGYGRFAEVKVWDAQTGTELRELVGHTFAVSSVAFSPDGTKIVTGSFDGTVKVWMADNQMPSIELKGPGNQ